MVAAEHKEDSDADQGGKRSRTQLAYDELRRLILDNHLKSGQQMFEQEVANLLKMSRTPVREALIRLAEDGLVNVRPRHGMTVLPISPGDMRDIYDVVTSLEATAAELAIEKGIDKARIDLLYGAVDAMETALQADDRTAWSRADEDFHKLLVRCSGNDRLIALVNGMWDQTHRARMATLDGRPMPYSSNVDHRDLIGAIERGDAELAKKIHVAHRKKARDLLLDLLLEMGLTEI